MKATGRVQVTAPKCTDGTGAAASTGHLASGVNGGAGNGSTTTVFSTGDSHLTAQAASGQASLVIAEGAGFQDSDVVTVGFGLANEEDITLTTFTEAQGAATLTAAANLTNTHQSGERVVVKTRGGTATAFGAIRPGSVVIKDDGTQSTAQVDNGDGTISGTDIASGTIDYATGHVTVTFSSAATIATTKHCTYDAELLTDDASQDNLTGEGFHKNFIVGSINRLDVPTHAIVSNLGNSKVGVFVETKKKNSNTWTSKGSGASVSLNSMGRGMIKLPGGTHTNLDLVRVRAGSDPDTPRSADDQLKPDVIEFDTINIINDNGQ